eukprot:scaffold1335_cov102-Isochrysis_galbana.AAC.2
MQHVQCQEAKTRAQPQRRDTDHTSPNSENGSTFFFEALRELEPLLLFCLQRPLEPLNLIAPSLGRGRARVGGRGR